MSYSEAAAKVMVELLGSYTEDNASQARVDAHRYEFSSRLHSHSLCLTVFLLMHAFLRCIVRALKDPNTFLFDHLLALKPVRFLEGELIHDVSDGFFLCTIYELFKSGRLNACLIPAPDHLCQCETCIIYEVLPEQQGFH